MRARSRGAGDWMTVVGLAAVVGLIALELWSNVRVTSLAAQLPPEASQAQLAAAIKRGLDGCGAVAVRPLNVQARRSGAPTGWSAAAAGGFTVVGASTEAGLGELARVLAAHCRELLGVETYAVATWGEPLELGTADNVAVLAVMLADFSSEASRRHDRRTESDVDRVATGLPKFEVVFAARSVP